MPRKSGRLAKEVSQHQRCGAVMTLMSRWQWRRHALRRLSSMTVGSTTAHRGVFLSVCVCVCARVHACTGRGFGQTVPRVPQKSPGTPQAHECDRGTFFFFLLLQTNPDTILKTGHHISCQRSELAGEVEGREKHDTSCLSNNGTTAPERVGGTVFNALFCTCQADYNKGKEGLFLGGKDKALTQGASARSPLH